MSTYPLKSLGQEAGARERVNAMPDVRARYRALKAPRRVLDVPNSMRPAHDDICNGERARRAARSREWRVRDQLRLM